MAGLVSYTSVSRSQSESSSFTAVALNKQTSVASSSSAHFPPPLPLTFLLLLLLLLPCSTPPPLYSLVPITRPAPPVMEIVPNTAPSLDLSLSQSLSRSLSLSLTGRCAYQPSVTSHLLTNLQSPMRGVSWLPMSTRLSIQHISPSSRLRFLSTSHRTQEFPRQRVRVSPCMCSLPVYSHRCCEQPAPPGVSQGGAACLRHYKAPRSSQGGVCACIPVPCQRSQEYPKVAQHVTQ